jgi:hypothetical protein
MPHTIQYNATAGVVEAIFQGNLTLNEAKNYINEVTQICKEHDCLLILNDYREATLNLSTMEIHGLPQIISERFTLTKHFAYQLKRAIVVARDLNDWNFFENVTINSGQTVKVFYDMDEAKKWLLGPN